MILNTTDLVTIKYFTTSISEVVTAYLTQIHVPEYMFIETYTKPILTNPGTLTDSYIETTYYQIAMKSYLFVFTEIDIAKKYLDMFIKGDFDTPVEEQIPEIFL